jgi:hypothetical protein
VPVPARPSRAKRFLNALLAAFSSPTAVTEEKNFLAFVVTRVLLSAGASAAMVAVVTDLITRL